MIGFNRILLSTCLILAVLIGSTIGLTLLIKFLDLTPRWMILLAGIIPALLAILTTAFIESWMTRQSIAECINSLGIGHPHLKQLRVSALCSIPILIAYITIFFGLHISPKLVAEFPSFLLKLIIAQGIAEEVVFRGFVFRRLRRGRSFWRAAFLSASIFSLAHFSHLFKGISAQVLIDMSVSIGFSFAMAPALALLFERGGNKIWGCSLLHFGYDSINLFANVSSETLSLDSLIFGAGILGSILMTLWLVPFLISTPTKSNA